MERLLPFHVVGSSDSVVVTVIADLVVAVLNAIVLCTYAFAITMGVRLALELVKL